MAMVLALGALGACASTSPAPIYMPQAATAPVTPAVPLPPIDFSGIDLSITPFDAATAPRVAYDQPYSECVPFARQFSGVQIWGDAVTWWNQADGKYPRSGIPAVGSVFVMRGYNDDKRGHVAVVSQVMSSRLIKVNQANWLKSGELTFDVPLVDVSPDNSWTQVRMWYVPTNAWGGRTYQAEGFIHPIALGGIS